MTLATFVGVYSNTVLQSLMNLLVMHIHKMPSERHPNK